MWLSWIERGCVMSKERELLRRISSHSESRIPAHFIYKLKELLAQPEQEPFAYVADSSVGFDVSHSVQGMPLLWLGKLEYGDKLYRVRAKDE
jgi:hypothetical protein